MFHQLHLTLAPVPTSLALCESGITALKAELSQQCQTIRKRKGLGAYLCYLGFVSSKTSGFVTGIFDPRWKVHENMSPGSLEQLRSGMTKCNVCFLHAGNTRVIKQLSLQKFQEEMETVMKDPYRVIMKQKKLPMSLFYDRIKPHVGITRCAGVCTGLPGQ